MLRQQHRFFRSVLIVADLLLIVAATVGAYFVRFELLVEWIPLRDKPSYSTHALPVHLVAPLILVSMMWCGLYLPRRDQRFAQEMYDITKAVLIGVAMAVVLCSLGKNVLFNGRHYSAAQFGILTVLTVLVLITWRYAFRRGLRAIRSRGWNLRHVAIIGTGRLGQVVCHTLGRNTWTGIKPSFFISHHRRTNRSETLGIPVVGGLDDLEAALDARDISGVMIALPGRMAAELPSLLARLERYSVDVRVIPDVNPKYLPINLAVNELDGMPILSVRESPLRHGWGRIAKRCVDVGGACAALLIFAIPMAVIAIVVRMGGSGPIIFRQQRMSLYGQRFNIFKFRTMQHVDAERAEVTPAPAPGYAPAPGAGGAEQGTAAWTHKNDPRVTPVGRFLRRTSLDELPQLFNVLIGEMSLVGPRPERPELIEAFREDWRGYMLRQNVKAGMTGWAQVNGLRGDTSLRKRLQYDLFYIRNWSLGFDLRILWMTVFRGFAHPNAH